MVDELAASPPSAIAPAPTRAWGSAEIGDRVFRAGLAVSAVVSALLGAVTLGREPLWIDELLTVALAERSFGDFLRELPDRQNGMLYDIVLWPVVKVGGASEEVVRLPALIATVLAVVVIGLVGARLGGRVMGLAAAALLAVNPFAVYYGQEARPYGFVLLFSVVSVWMLLRAIERPTVSRWVLYAASLVLLVYSHDFAVLSVLAHPLLLLGASRRARIGFTICVAPLVIAIISLLILVPPTQGANALWWVPAPGPLARGRDSALTFAGDWWGFAACVLVIAAGIAAMVLWRRTDPELRVSYTMPLFLAVWLLLPFLVLFTVSHFQPVLVTRYVLQSLPALCLLIAFCLSLMRMRVALALGAVVMVAFLASTIRGAIDVTKEDWPGVAAHLSTRSAPEEPIAFLGGDISAVDGLLYYGRGFGIDRDHLIWQGEEDERLPQRFVVVPGNSDGSKLLDVARRGEPVLGRADERRPRQRRAGARRGQAALLGDRSTRLSAHRRASRRWMPPGSLGGRSLSAGIVV